MTFGLQVIENSSLVSVLFREAFSHHYISFLHLPVDGFSVMYLSLRLLKCFKGVNFDLMNMS